MSLLDVAKKTKKHKTASIPNKEEIELALAWARGEIGISQVQIAYESVKGNRIKGGSNMYLPLARALREYITANKL